MSTRTSLQVLGSRLKGRYPCPSPDSPWIACSSPWALGSGQYVGERHCWFSIYGSAFSWLSACCAQGLVHSSRGLVLALLMEFLNGSCGRPYAMASSVLIRTSWVRHNAKRILQARRRLSLLSTARHGTCQKVETMSPLVIVANDGILKPSYDAHVVVANLGDCRAVLCRGGKAVPLSEDHKPNRAGGYCFVGWADYYMGSHRFVL